MFRTIGRHYRAMRGDRGNTAFGPLFDTDSTPVDGNRHTFTAYGNAQIDGDRAGVFTGVGTADYIETADSADFDLPGDFTVDFWLNPTSFTSDVWYGRDAGFITLQANSSGGAGNHIKLIRYAEASHGTGGTLTNGVWTHLAVVRSGTTVKVYQDGTEIISATDSTSVDLSSPLNLGRNGATYNNYANCYISRLQFRKGYANWTSNFTSPVRTTDIVLDAYTVLALNFRGDAGSTDFIDSAT